MATLYKEIYGPHEADITLEEYSSSDESLRNHISKKQHHRQNSDEFENFLRAPRAPPMCNILDWWKVLFFQFSFYF